MVGLTTGPGSVLGRCLGIPTEQFAREFWAQAPLLSRADTLGDGGFKDLPGLLGYIDRLKGAAKLRPDSKLIVSRNWPTPDARLEGAVQISRGLARVAAAGERANKSELEPA